MAATGALGRQWWRDQIARRPGAPTTIESSASRAKQHIGQAREARAAGRPDIAAAHLHSAAAYRHDAMELAGLPYAGLQRPNHFYGGDILGNGIKKTRKLP